MNTALEMRSLQRYQAEYGVAGGLFTWSNVKRAPEKLVMLFRVVGEIGPGERTQERYGTEDWETTKLAWGTGSRPTQLKRRQRVAILKRATRKTASAPEGVVLATTAHFQFPQSAFCHHPACLSSFHRIHIHTEEVVMAEVNIPAY